MLPQHQIEIYQKVAQYLRKPVDAWKDYLRTKYFGMKAWMYQKLSLEQTKLKESVYNRLNLVIENNRSLLKYWVSWNLKL